MTCLSQTSRQAVKATTIESSNDGKQIQFTAVLHSTFKFPLKTNNSYKNYVLYYLNFVNFQSHSRTIHTKFHYYNETHYKKKTFKLSFKIIRSSKFLQKTPLMKKKFNWNDF